MTTNEMSSADAPNVVDVDSQAESKITNVNLYSGQAEVTRAYRLTVVRGVNKLVLTKLPELLQDASLRLSSSGTGAIQNVSFSLADVGPPESERLTLLRDQKENIEHALQRSTRCLTGLENYLKTLDARNIEASKLSEFMESYDTSTEKFDSRLKAQRKELVKVEEDIKSEQSDLADKISLRRRVRKVISIEYHADESGEIGIQAIYAISSASWTATYDLRVSTEPTHQEAHLVYKATISQSTGESWDNVSLALQTASPQISTNFFLHTLYPWKLSLMKPQVEEEESDDDMGFGLFDGDEGGGGAVAASLSVARGSIARKGDLNASYNISGLCTIPTHSQESSTVTVQEFDFPKKLLWTSVPKHDPRIKLRVDITNNSEYSLVSGTARIILDGSFLSSIRLNEVGPREVFNVPLGVDRSLRITYHHRENKAYSSGFYTKLSNHLFTQRITISSTKATTVDDLTILDQIPVSEDNAITVSLKSPPLKLPPTEDDANDSSARTDVMDKVKIENGIYAYWHDSAKTGDWKALGKDGMVKWVCRLAPEQKANLLLQWEVSAPLQTPIIGLSG